MTHNLVSDVIDFLLQPAWTTVAFWLLLQLIFAVHDYGRSLGADAVIAERCRTRRVFRSIANVFA